MTKAKQIDHKFCSKEDQDEIEVELITKETIKPSSPTPHHLHHHQLSFLDQLAPHAYVPFLYFYEFNGSTKHQSNLQPPQDFSIQSLDPILPFLLESQKQPFLFTAKTKASHFLKLKSKPICSLMSSPTPASLSSTNCCHSSWMKSQKQPLVSSSMCLNVEELLLGYASHTELQTASHVLLIADREQKFYCGSRFFCSFNFPTKKYGWVFRGSYHQQA
ncbi:hypothetical protein Prudu_002102 [Prunus dulcis]|uniref:Uncharacterized protein n=1 Tax=Prunus dulcis TaxID=3755 RepID=A0A4Y1QQ01_PRUDU|nr:hypothetical protein Prudu_002102 [Prunus dulcis]